MNYSLFRHQTFVGICVRITIVGLASVGKTTIVKRTFNNLPLKEVGTIRPTMFKEFSEVEPAWTSENVDVLDLGGQAGFLEQHLTKDNFDKDLVLFVVDLQNLKQVGPAAKYFARIQDIMLQLPKQPKTALFFHKYDPESAPALQVNILHYTQQCLTALSKLNPQTYLTSIFDRSIFQAITTLFIQLSQGDALKLGMSLINPSSWALDQIESKFEGEQYLRVLGTQQGRLLRDTWVKLIQEKATIKPGEGELRYDFTGEGDQIKLRIDLSSLPEKSHEELYLSAFFGSYFRTLYYDVDLSQEEGQLCVDIQKDRLIV